MFGVVQDMPGVDEAEYRLVEKHLGPEYPLGLVAHVAGPVEGGWRIVNVWESEDAYRRFTSERLLKAAGIAAQTEGFDPAKAAGFGVHTVAGNDLAFR
jgi:hypothetical protein